VTGRMLKMFRRKTIPAPASPEGGKAAVTAAAAHQNGSGS